MFFYPHYTPVYLSGKMCPIRSGEINLQDQFFFFSTIDLTVLNDDVFAKLFQVDPLVFYLFIYDSAEGIVLQVGVDVDIKPFRCYH